MLHIQPINQSEPSSVDPSKQIYIYIYIEIKYRNPDEDLDPHAHLWCDIGIIIISY